MNDRFKNWEMPEIKDGKLTKWNWIVVHKENFKLGYKTDIGAFVYIQAQHKVVIEDFVQVGGGVKIYSVDTIDDVKGGVILKKNCKVGANSVILPGVVIGENSAIGSCSVVKYNTKVPQNEFWAGCPAKFIRKIGYIKNEKKDFIINKTKRFI